MSAMNEYAEHIKETEGKKFCGRNFQKAHNFSMLIFFIYCSLFPGIPPFHTSLSL